MFIMFIFVICDFFMHFGCHVSSFYDYLSLDFGCVCVFFCQRKLNNMIKSHFLSGETGEIFNL